MKIKNPFFVKHKYIYLSEIFKVLGIKKINEDVRVNNIRDLINASVNDISFINNSKYLDLLKKSKVKYVICNEKYLKK